MGSAAIWASTRKAGRNSAVTIPSFRVTFWRIEARKPRRSSRPYLSYPTFDFLSQPPQENVSGKTINLTGTSLQAPEQVANALRRYTKKAAQGQLSSPGAARVLDVQYVGQLPTPAQRLGFEISRAEAQAQNVELRVGPFLPHWVWRWVPRWFMP